MKYTKYAINIDQQLAQLRSRGLHIADEPAAKDTIAAEFGTEICPVGQSCPARDTEITSLAITD